jgi:hypothetical protein
MKKYRFTIFLLNVNLMHEPNILQERTSLIILRTVKIPQNLL